MDLSIIFNLLLKILTKAFVVVLTTTIVFMVVPVISFFYIVRETVKYLGKHYFGLNAIDVFSSLMAAEDVYSPEALTMALTLVTNTAVFDKQMVINLVQKNLLDKLDKEGNVQYPELKYVIRPWLGYLFWEQVSSFNLKNHVLNYADTGLSIPDWSDPQALRLITSQMLRCRNWKKGVPLWEIIILNNVPNSHLRRNNSNGSLFIWRFHHVLKDGYATFKVLTQLFGISDVVYRAAIPTTASIYDGHMTLSQIRAVCAAPFKLVEQSLQTMKCPPELPKLFQGNENKILCHGRTTFCLDELKGIRRKFNVDLTSVVVAIVAGGIRRFLIKYGKELPNKVTIYSPLPMPNHPDKLRNHVGASMYPIPLREEDGFKRLQEIGSVSPMFRDVGVLLLTHLLGKIPGLFPQSFIKAFKSKVNMPPVFLSNLVGPAEPVQLEEISFTDIQVGVNLPLDGPLGFCFAFLSYNGEAKLAVSAFNEYLESFQHADELLEFCRDEVAELMSFSNREKLE